MLTVKIEIEKTKENYQAVLEALRAFDIASASWEDGQAQVNVDLRSGVTDPSDLSAQVSAAVAKARRNLGQ